MKDPTASSWFRETETDSGAIQESSETETSRLQTEAEKLTHFKTQYLSTRLEPALK